VAIEAPFQIMLTATLISLGVLKLPGTEQNSFKNAYGFEIDFQWWPVATTILSFLGILFGTLWMFSPIVKETGKVVGYLTFIPIFLFRFDIHLQSSKKKNYKHFIRKILWLKKYVQLIANRPSQQQIFLWLIGNVERHLTLHCLSTIKSLSLVMAFV
jgi:hypothetical protein